MRIIEVLTNTFLRLRRVGSTTACIEGLKSVGGGTLIVPSYKNADDLRRAANSPEIEFVSISSVGNFIGRDFDKPVLIDPAGLVELFRMIEQEKDLASTKRADAIKRIEKDLEELKRI